MKFVLDIWPITLWGSDERQRSRAQVSLDDPTPQVQVQILSAKQGGGGNGYGPGIKPTSPPVMWRTVYHQTTELVKLVIVFSSVLIFYPSLSPWPSTGAGAEISPLQIGTSTHLWRGAGTFVKLVATQHLLFQEAETECFCLLGCKQRAKIRCFFVIKHERLPW